MIIGVDRPKKKSARLQVPYQGELGVCAMAQHFGRRVPSVDVPSSVISEPVRKSDKKPKLQPELGVVAAAQYFGRRLPFVSDAFECLCEPEFD